MRTFILALAGILLYSAPASAWCRMTTINSSVGAPACATQDTDTHKLLAWERRCIEYAIEQSGTPSLSRTELEEVVADSIGAWITARCAGSLQPIDISIRKYYAPSLCREAQYRSQNVNTVAFLDDWTAHGYDPDAFALTTVWHSKTTGQILDADLQINEALGPYLICPDDGCWEDAVGNSIGTDLQNVLTHEFGHFFGVAHTPVRGATMFAESDRGETAKRILRTDDVEAICNIYPPGSMTALECDYTPLGGRNLVCAPEGGSSCAASIGARSGPVPLLLAAAGVAILAGRRRRR